MKSSKSDSGHGPHEGKRYINLIRCSSAHQGDTSIPDQLQLLQQFAQSQGMIHVDNVILDGVSGSIPGARVDIEQLIHRKLEKDDFEVILLQDMSRLTRGGAEHAGKIEFDLRAVGIEILYASENLPEGDHASIIKSVGFYAAKQHAKAISFSATRGQMSAIEEGRTPYCSTPPYGVDRLIINLKGEELFILREMADGSQQKLDPKTRQVLHVYPPNKKRGQSSHYRRQVDERIVLIPGSDEQVHTVRNIFRWSLIDGLGRFRIARRLNEMGIPSRFGGTWSTSTVASVLRNGIYLGRGVANRHSLAVYNMRAPKTPAPAKVDPQVLATRKAPQQRVRPKKDWMQIDCERLKEFLDTELREAAAASQAKFWGAKGAGTTPKFSRDKHTDSPYILKNIAKDAASGLPLTGRMQGGKKYPTRYYAISRAFENPSEDLSRRHIPAEPLERAVLAAIRKELIGTPELENEIRQLVEGYKKAQAQIAVSADQSQLQAERVELQQQLEFIFDSVGTLGRDLAKRKIEQIERRLKEIDRLTKQSATRSAARPIDVEQEVQKLMAKLKMLGDALDGLPPSALRTLLAAVIDRLDIDMETRAVKLELKIAGAMPMNQKESSNLGLDGSRPWQIANETQAEIIAKIDCNWLLAEKCYECHRRKAA